MTDDNPRSPFRCPVALVTGAAGGMGLACARRLANTHALILTDVNDTRLAAICDTLRDEDNAEIVAAICGDIANDGTIREIATAFAASNGGCKILVHTAGLSPALADWGPILRTNIVGTAKLLDAVEPLLTEGFVGVLLSSTARCFVPQVDGMLSAVLAQPLAHDLLERLAPLLGNDLETRTANAYAYSKAWVCQTVQQRATRWAEHGARIASLSPGFIRTGMTRKEVVERPEMQKLLASTPMGRWGTVSDIANAVEFIVSDKASYITGTDIVIDGGLSARILTQG
ncbi:NAD(P)-dependent dehydrogenase (short-subunit alcohol dehydrogenase family) [Novosphingobium hassiacum]|uniref:NAD(P)-dependent dehydrogenase (Short-subunit alcohol dehydrogenase family) n=1 Tax=Novosphingobium hassiacum TaxID=173676 RepID=A0A7W5ZY53_9SPHN|nr:SDR family oxidoreductase [Novosphingobium hassiacum]MBB3862163.1 NAD(P)-dependent dehydrogenase (short-subunit alcohol dehydrogenase family) [Novosphingobium hassiacum]